MMLPDSVTRSGIRPPSPAEGFGGGGTGFSMLLEYPKTAAVKDYLRTVDFDSTELQVHWTDEHGEWLGRTFASRPDNVVVQWLTAPKGQPLNVRVTMQRSADVGRGGGRGAAAAATAAAGAQVNTHQDFNEQRLVFKGIFDPSVDNSGYAAVTRVVRTGGSARMDGGTLVIENASSVMLLTRIERLSNYSSRPGVIEVLPALPPALVKGSMNGMLARTRARIRSRRYGPGLRCLALERDPPPNWCRHELSGAGRAVRGEAAQRQADSVSYDGSGKFGTRKHRGEP